MKRVSIHLAAAIGTHIFQWTVLFAFSTRIDNNNNSMCRDFGTERKSGTWIGGVRSRLWPNSVLRWDHASYKQVGVHRRSHLVCWRKSTVWIVWQLLLCFSQIVIEGLDVTETNKFHASGYTNRFTTPRDFWEALGRHLGLVCSKFSADLWSDWDTTPCKFCYFICRK